MKTTVPAVSGVPRRRALALACALACGHAIAAELAPQLRSDAARNGGADVLIVLPEQARPLLAPLAAQANYTARRRALVDALRARADAQQAALRAWLAARGIAYRAYWVANLIQARIGADTLEALAARGDVARIVADARLPLHLPAPATNDGVAAPALIPWGVQAIGAPAVWALGITGQGVVIEDSDSGQQWDHPALKTQYRGWDGIAVDHNRNWHDAVHAGADGTPCPQDALAPCDGFGHGTHTAGSALGDDGASNRIGVAPGAQWIGCRNGGTDGNSNFSLAQYVECLQWTLAPTDLADANPDPERAPDISTNSWDCRPEEGCVLGDEIREAVGHLVEAGIFFAAAAANDGPDCGTLRFPPAIHEFVFTVGATDSGDRLADFSSRGPTSAGDVTKPDLSAPGVGIRSAFPGNGYFTWGGTSMATPHVAGAAALVIAANPALRGHPEQIGAILRASAATEGVTDPVDQACGGTPATQWPNFMIGHGRLDALAAVRMALALALALRDAIFADGFEPPH